MKSILLKNIFIIARNSWIIILFILSQSAISQEDVRIVPDPNNGRSNKFSWRIKPRSGEIIADVHILLNCRFNNGDFYNIIKPTNWLWNLRIQESPPGSGNRHYSLNFFIGKRGKILDQDHYTEFSFMIREAALKEAGGASQNEIILTGDGDDEVGDNVDVLLGITPGYRLTEFHNNYNMGLGFNFGIGRLEADLRHQMLRPFYFSYFRFHPTIYLGLSAELGFSVLSAREHPKFSAFNTKILPFELSVLLYLPTIRLPYFDRVSPFFQLGGGAVYWIAKSGNNVIIDPESNERQQKLDSFLKTGGGIAWRVADHWLLDIGGTFRFSFTDAFDQLWQGDERDQILEVRIGATYYFKNWELNNNKISAWNVVNSAVGVLANVAASYLVLRKQDK